MKTCSLIIDEKLTASRIPLSVFDQHIRSLIIPGNILSLKAGIFSRDGPFLCCK
jgi:hypothetical protein